MVSAADIFLTFHDRIILCLFAALAHALFVNFRIHKTLKTIQPETWGASISAALEQRLNRMGRSDSVRRTRGIIAAILLLSWGLALGGFLGWAFHHLPAGEFFQLAIIALMLSARAAFDTAIAIYDHVKKGKPVPPSITSGLIHTQREISDSNVAVRIAIETLMVRIQTGFTAPLMWYILLGLPGMISCITFTAAYENLKTRGMYGWSYGRAIRFMYLCMQYVPQIFTGYVVCLGAVFIPSCHPMHALRTMLLESAKLKSTAVGWVQGAASGALTVLLAGPQSGYLIHTQTPWIGFGAPRCSPRDLVRACLLFGIALQIIVLGIAGLLYAYK